MHEESEAQCVKNVSPGSSWEPGRAAEQHMVTIVLLIGQLTVSPKMNVEHKYFTIRSTIPKASNKVSHLVNLLNLLSEIRFSNRFANLHIHLKVQGLKIKRLALQFKGAKVLRPQRTETHMEKGKKHQYFADFTTLTLECVPFVNLGA